MEFRRLETSAAAPARAAAREPARATIYKRRMAPGDWRTFGRWGVPSTDYADRENNDKWMEREFPDIPFERYADDRVPRTH